MCKSVHHWLNFCPIIWELQRVGRGRLLIPHRGWLITEQSEKAEAGSNKKIKGFVAIFNLERKISLNGWVSVQKFNLSEWMIMGINFHVKASNSFLCSDTQNWWIFGKRWEGQVLWWDSGGWRVYASRPLLIMFLHASNSISLRTKQSWWGNGNDYSDYNEFLVLHVLLWRLQW